tara:strand:- start:706 stop:1848 length:1143 start_codon:yes stop_codon:yes gene_type:complete
MDDFNVSGLSESRNEYSAMLVSRLTPQIITGINSIFNEAVELCQQNDEEQKYLMTFQNFLGRVPKWNQDIVDNEKERIIKSTNCAYLEDLLTCVHITQLKVLTVMRVGNKQKKIDIDIPSLSTFLHKVYISVSRKVYKNVFLYEQNVLPLQKQKNMRELENIVKECILGVIRDNMPIEAILRSYLDETTEEEVEQIKEQIEEVIEPISTPVVETETAKDETEPVNVQTEPINAETEPVNVQTEPVNVQTEPINAETNVTKVESNITIDTEDKSSVTSEGSKHIDFSDNDNVLDYDKYGLPGALSSENTKIINAPKTNERLEEISEKRWEERRLEDDDDDDDAPLKIMSDIKLDTLDVHNINANLISLEKPDILGDVVQLS